MRLHFNLKRLQRRYCQFQYKQSISFGVSVSTICLLISCSFWNKKYLKFYRSTKFNPRYEIADFWISQIKWLTVKTHTSDIQVCTGTYKWHGSDIRMTYKTISKWRFLPPIKNIGELNWMSNNASFCSFL